MSSEAILNEFAATWPGLKKKLDEFDAIQTSYAEMKKKIEGYEAKFNRPGMFGNPGVPEMSEQMKAFNLYLRKGGVVPDSVKTQLTQAADGSSYLAPTEFQQEMLKSITFISPIRDLGRKIQTSAAAVKFPKRTGQFAAQWINENGTRAETTGLTVGQENIPVNEMFALVDIPKVTMEDASFPVDQFVMDEMALQFAKAEGAAFIVGDGIGKPEGFNIAKFQSSYVPSTNASLLTTDGVIKLIYGVKPQYRPDGAFVCNTLTVAALRTLKDTAGRYIFAEPAMKGQNPTLMGYPVYECPDMPDIAANAFPLAFGNFNRGYIIADRIDMDILVDNVTQATVGNVRFIGRKRVGGQCVMSEAIALQKVAVS